MGAAQARLYGVELLCYTSALVGSPHDVDWGQDPRVCVRNSHRCMLRQSLNRRKPDLRGPVPPGLRPLAVELHHNARRERGRQLPHGRSPASVNAALKS